MSPHDLLPIKAPSEFDPSESNPTYFYDNVIKPLIPDFIRIMDTPLTMNWEAVEELRTTIDNVLDIVANTLAKNEIIKKFQEAQYPKKFAEYREEVLKSCRDVEYYIKEYKDSIVHRTYLVNHILSIIDQEDMQKDKWSVKDIKSLNTFLEDPKIAKVINKQYKPTDTIVQEAMLNLASDKVAIWNKVREDKIDVVKREDLVPPFNPGSSKQKSELFEYLGIEPLAYSKDNPDNASWGRPQIEELFHTVEDKTLTEVLQMFIDYSFSAIIKNNFIESFDAFTLDNSLYSNLKLFGAKSFRPTGNGPNLLQMPSTGSIYAKPLKKCFVAPEGYMIATIDYSALEDRVIANLSGDNNKLAVFTEGLDGHSLAATYYFPDKVEKSIGKYTDNKEASKKLKDLVDQKDKVAKKIRQDGKPVTFGISYGAYPPKIAATIKCPIEEAEGIFHAYHEEMYPDITKMRNQIIGKAKYDGYVHLGLGCRLYSNDVEKGSRTLFNAVSQFWSILTLLAINKLHEEIDKDEKQEDIKITTTIYDSIYLVVKKDAKTIQWLNNIICPIMEKDFLEDQIVANSANLEIGDSWANLIELKHSMSIEEIEKVINEF